MVPLLHVSDLDVETMLFSRGRKDSGNEWLKISFMSFMVKHVPFPFFASKHNIIDPIRLCHIKFIITTLTNQYT